MVNKADRVCHIIMAMLLFCTLQSVSFHGDIVCAEIRKYLLSIMMSTPQKIWFACPKFFLVFLARDVITEIW